MLKFSYTQFLSVKILPQRGKYKILPMQLSQAP